MMEASRPTDPPGVPLPLRVHSPRSRAHHSPTRSPVTGGVTGGTMPGFVNSSSGFTLAASASHDTRRPSLGSWSTMHKSGGIKYGRGKYSDVELMPQPSDDPEDPLNWPRWRKDLNLAALLSVVALAGVLKTVFLTTASVAASRYRTPSHLAIAALTGVPLVLSALTGTAACVAARVWGRRPVYLLATAALFVGTAWNATAVSSYGSCLGARVLQGLAWGVFDTLVMTSIQDTYFEHQRNLRVTLYNLLNTTATWGAPLLGGRLASAHPADPVYQLRLVAGFFLLAVPLVCLAAPETAFDRARAAAAAAATPPTSVSGFTLSSRAPRRWQPWRLRHRLTRARALAYLRDDLSPLSSAAAASRHRPAVVTRALLLQAPRALAAPTTLLVALLGALPGAALWGLAASLAPLLAPPPVGAGPATLGAVMTGPWLAPVALVAASLALYRGVHLQFTRLVGCLVVCGGSCLALVGILSFGLGVGNFMTASSSSSSSSSSSLFSEDGAAQLSLALVSFQLAVLAAGAAVLDAATRPSLARSASFTASNLTAALRSIGDMHAGVVVYRNLVAGVLAMAVPVAVARPGGLRAVTLGLAAAQLVASGVVVAQRCYFDEAVWRADGRVMGLIDLSSLKLSANYFEPEERA